MVAELERRFKRRLDDAADEQERVLLWRQFCCERLGYSAKDAAELAVEQVDVHRLEDLIRRGCSLRLAARIVV